MRLFIFLLGDLIGELKDIVFYTATFSLNFLRGSFLSTLSSSSGVYTSKNSSMLR